jgi:mRNA interferase MazF
MVVARFDVYLVRLDPTQGREIQKTRPCVVLSPDEMNRHIETVIVAPMTTKGRTYPTRVPLRFQRKVGQIVLDQVRTVDKSRLVRRLGKISDRAALLLALKDVAAAKGGLGKLARKADLNRAHVYKALSGDGNPRLDTMEKTLNSLGFRLSIEPLAE